MGSRPRTLSRAALLARLQLGDWDVVFIDGRSGAGKTLLAAELAGLFPTAVLLRVEELYPGWDGLAAGAAEVARVLRTRRYRQYDWERGKLLQARELPGALPLVVEGCGAISCESLQAAETYAYAVRAAAGEDAAAVRAAASPRIVSIWLELPEDVRKRRALARDGDMYAPYWEMWAAQEEALFSRVRPWEFANFLVTETL